MVTRMPRRAAPRGFTLVELMVSLVLFALLAAGVLSVAVSMSQGFREQRQVITTDTQVRAPMDYLGDVIRMASPGVPNGDITASVGDPNCDYYGAGFMHSDTPPSNQALVVGNNQTGPTPVVGSDTLDVTYASGGVMTSLTAIFGATAGENKIMVLDSTGISPGDTLLVTNGTQGHLVFVTAVGNTPPNSQISTLPSSACSDVAMPTGGYPITSLVIRVVRMRYVIANDPQTSIPGLYVAQIGSSGMTGLTAPPTNYQPVAEGIEDMQIAIGQDLNADNQIDFPTEWVYGGDNNNNATGNPFNKSIQVRGLRVTLIGRSAGQLVGGPGTSGRPGAEDHTPGPATDNFRRRVLTATFETRNLGSSL